MQLRLFVLVALVAIILSAYNPGGMAQLARAQYSEQTTDESSAPTTTDIGGGTYVIEQDCASVEIAEGYYVYYSPTEPNYFCVHPATQSPWPIFGDGAQIPLPALLHLTKGSTAVLKGNLLLPPYRSFTLRVSCPPCDANSC